MANQADRLFQQGLALLNQERLEQAREIFEKVVKINPKHFDAFHLLGIIAAQLNAFEAADVLFDKAIKLNRNNPYFYCNRGNVLKELKQFKNAISNYDKAIGINKDFALAHLNKSIALCDLERFEEALSSVDNAIQVKSNYAEAYYQRGFNLKELKRYDDALASYNQAIEIKPDFAEAYSSRGTLLAEFKRFAESIVSYETAIQLKPDFAEAYLNQANVFKELKRFDESLASYDKAIELKRDYADAYSNRAIVLKELKRFEEALASCYKAIDIKPDFAEAYLNQGNVLKELNFFEDALNSYNKAIDYKFDFAEAYSSRGILLAEFKRFEESLTSYDKAIEHKRDFADAHLNKSFLLLSLQNFENGWQLYEWRWKSIQKISYREFSQPLWLGIESLENKTILLHAEQGLGDTIQFCRYAALVKQTGAKVLLEVPKSLIELLKDLEGVDVLLEQGKQLPPFDYHCPLLSLPLAFKTRLETIPFAKPYLKANQNKTNYWQKRIGNLTNLKVGLVWNGGFRANQSELWTVNERRNISLRILANKLSAINVNFYSLQKGEPADSEIRGQENLYWPNNNFFNFTNEIIDFSDTAALIENMDLIIAVDTSTAHLAAALGKPTWILNRFDSCWRWMLDRDDSPWYESVKLYRQGEDRQWDAVLERVAGELKKLDS